MLAVGGGLKLAKACRCDERDCLGYACEITPAQQRVIQAQSRHREEGYAGSEEDDCRMDA